MPEDESKQYQITISGNRFSITSPYGEEHVRKVETYLADLISEVTQQTDNLGPTTTALLVALNLADELISLKKREEECQAMENDLESLCNRLDNVLAKSTIVKPVNEIRPE